MFFVCDVAFRGLTEGGEVAEHGVELPHEPRVEREEERDEPAPLGPTEEHGRKGCAEEQPLHEGDRGVIEVEQLEGGAEGVAAADVGGALVAVREVRDGQSACEPWRGPSKWSGAEGALGWSRVTWVNCARESGDEHERHHLGSDLSLAREVQVPADARRKGARSPQRQDDRWCRRWACEAWSSAQACGRAPPGLAEAADGVLKRLRHAAGEEQLVVQEHNKVLQGEGGNVGGAARREEREGRSGPGSASAREVTTQLSEEAAESCTADDVGARLRGVVRTVESDARTCSGRGRRGRARLSPRTVAPARSAPSERWKGRHRRRAGVKNRLERPYHADSKMYGFLR